MVGRDRRAPDFFLIGAPKAGTSALHAALAQHPGLFVSRVKEPKYYMCGDSPPPSYKGPGDAHSNQEWVWQRERYLSLFDGAPDGRLRGESTPFYLYNRDARRRIAVDNPDARLIAVLRDPVDRAYSNWMHLRMDGLEPEADLVEAARREQRRVDAGWAPFWHYRGLGMYGRRSPICSTTSRASSCSCCATAPSSTTRSTPSTASATFSASTGPGCPPCRRTTRDRSSSTARAPRPSGR